MGKSKVVNKWSMKSCDIKKLDTIVKPDGQQNCKVFDYQMGQCRQPKFLA